MIQHWRKRPVKNFNGWKNSGEDCLKLKKIRMPNSMEIQLTDFFRFSDILKSGTVKIWNSKICTRVFQKWLRDSAEVTAKLWQKSRTAFRFSIDIRHSQGLHQSHVNNTKILGIILLKSDGSVVILI